MSKPLSYTGYIKSDFWLARRLDFINKVGAKCVKCRKITNLNVHHKTYVRMGNEFDSDLVVLCSKCHSKLHKIQKRLNLSVEDASLRFLNGEVDDTTTTRKEVLRRKSLAKKQKRVIEAFNLGTDDNILEKFNKRQKELSIQRIKKSTNE